MSDIQREKVITIKGNKYKLKFPTVGDFLDIEIMKQDLSGGNYRAMGNSGLVTQSEAIKRINMIAYFTVLLPEDFKKESKIESFSNLDLIDSIELVKVYSEEVDPWIETWLKALIGGEKTPQKP